MNGYNKKELLPTNKGVLGTAEEYIECSFFLYLRKKPYSLFSRENHLVGIILLV